MTEAEAAGDPVLARAVQDAVGGAVISVTDDEPLGLALRAASRDNPQIATMLRLVLAGRQLDALVADYHLHRTSRIPNWREQYISDFGSVDVPAGDMRAAEAAYRERKNRRPPDARQILAIGIPGAGLRN